ncbi:MAG: FecR domain-containing protein [Myxococcota bacterium]|nr:FecR domain-containing protein [Myxococcota bacterium]
MASRLNLEREAAAVRSRIDAERLSGRESVELSHRIEASLSGERQGWRVAFAASGVLCVIALWLVVALRPPQRNEQDCMREHAGFIDIDPACRGPVSIERGGDVILAHAGAHLEESAQGMRVRHGKVSFVVQKRERGATMRVLVSHGAIEVVGTRFTVTQEDQGGKVKLEEGSIKFHWLGGDESTVVPGEELEWPPRPKPTPVTLDDIPLDAPVEVVAPPKPQAPAKAPRPTPPKPPEAPKEEKPEEQAAEADEPSGPMLMEDVLKKMSTLRSQHRYREAVELLRAQSDRGDFSGLQQARLSFEIGLLLQDRMDDKAGACAQWKQHARRYPDDASHADRVQEYIRACEEAP